VSQHVFFPYAYAPAAFDCQWSIPGLSYSTTSSGALRLDDDLPFDRALSLHVRARLAPGVFDRVLPEAERSGPPVRIALVLRSPSSRLREAVPLDEVEPGYYGGSVTLPRSRIHGEIEAFVAIVRTEDGAPHPGMASHRAAILGSSESVAIQLEEPIAPPGAYLDVDFEDFGQSANQLRRRNADQLFALDLDGEMPRLWLNEGIPEFANIMLSKARRGLPRRIRDATFDTVTVQVWTSLIATSIGSLAAVLDGELEPAEALDSIDEWQSRVLHYWAPRLFPELSDADSALASLCQLSIRRERLAEVYERVSVGVQRQARSVEAFSGLIRVLHDEGV
jgi:hypothetical protein